MLVRIAAPDSRRGALGADRLPRRPPRATSPPRARPRRGAGRPARSPRASSSRRAAGGASADAGVPRRAPSSPRSAAARRRHRARVDARRVADARSPGRLVARALLTRSSILDDAAGRSWPSEQLGCSRRQAGELRGPRYPSSASTADLTLSSRPPTSRPGRSDLVTLPNPAASGRRPVARAGSQPARPALVCGVGVDPARPAVGLRVHDGAVERATVTLGAATGPS